MLEEELDKFTLGRRIYDLTNSTEWSIDKVDNSSDVLYLSDDYGNTRQMTVEYFRSHCIFSDDLFMFGSRKSESSLKCECGVDKLGYGNHSHYCPKYQEGK